MLNKIIAKKALDFRGGGMVHFFWLCACYLMLTQKRSYKIKPSYVNGFRKNRYLHNI